MTAILSTYFVITLYNHKYNIRIAQFPKTFKHNAKKNYKKKRVFPINYLEIKTKIYIDLYGLLKE